MSDYEVERARVIAREAEKSDREIKPGMLLLKATPGAGADELAELAEKTWPKMEAERRAKIVQRAIEVQEEKRGRRVDPADVEGLVHPSRRDETMAVPSKSQLWAFIRALIEDDPEIDYGEINQEVNKWSDEEVSRSKTSQIARAIREETEAPAAAEPAETVALEASSSNGHQVTQERKTVDVPADRVEVSERASLERRVDFGARTNRVQVDADPESGHARLFVDIGGLTAAAAWRIAAAVQTELAKEAA